MIITDLFESPQTCPECGGPSFSDLILAEKKDACYHKVKASAKVWPSAYASGRLVQCRKKGADNYGNKNESQEQLDEKCWDGYQQQGMKNKSGRQVPNCVPAESINEMDKSQTPPGRDGSNDSDAGKKEYTATPTTPGAVARQGSDILNKAFRDSQRVDPRTGKKMNTKGVAEATGDQKFDSMMGQITGGATARQSVDSLNKSLTARTGSDPETALAKWGQEFINWLEKICRNFERQGVDRFNKLEKVGNLDDGGETMAHWLIEVAKQSNTSGITQADIQEFSSEFNTHGMWAWHQFPIAWGLKEWQDYKDQWTGPDGYMANLGQGMAEGLAQDEAEEDSGWQAEFVNEINYNTFEVKLTNTRSKESANFIVRPVDMVSYGPTLSIETMDVHDLQTGQTESWTNDDPAPDGPIAYAISGLFYDDKQLQKKLQNIIDTHDTKGQDMMPGLEKRRSIGQEVDADAYIDSQEKTQAAMAKMKKGVAEKLGDNRPKLGSKRDAGKSIRKWRKSRGLDETGVAEGLGSGVDAKGRTQQQWIRLVKAKYPDARIMQSKMIDGPCQAILSDGRKLSWIKVDNQSTEIDEASWNPTTGGDYPVDYTGREMVIGPSDQKWQAAIDYYNDAGLVRRALQDLANKNSGKGPQQYVATFANQITNRDQTRYFKSKSEAYEYARISGHKLTSIEKLDNDEVTPPVTYNVILGVKEHRRMFKLTFASDEVAQKWEHDNKDVVKIQWNDERGQYSPPTTPRAPDTYGGKIPGDETGQVNEKSVSQAQFRTMAAAAHNPEFAKKVGISQDVAKEFHSADKNSNYKKLPDRTNEEGERGRGRPMAGDWDPTAGKVGRVEKTPTGVRHHADPSRYGGTEQEPELDALNKNTINAMDRALGVKWDRESKKYFSPLKVDMDEGEQQKGADYRDPPEADYGDDYQDMVARVKKLAGLGPLKTVYDPQKRVYRNMPTAVQPKK